MLMRLRPRIQAIVLRWLLGLWLFAMVQSLANACLVQPRHTAEHRGEAALRVDHEGEHEHADAGAQVCLQTCDAAGSAAWSVNPFWSVDLGLALPAAFRPWTRLPDDAAQTRFAGPAPPGDPPATIRFLRLNR